MSWRRPAPAAGMIKLHYPELFADEPRVASRAPRRSAAKTHRADQLPRRRPRHEPASTRAFAGTVTYHDSCSGLRELGVRDQPRRLLEVVAGLKLSELTDAEVCCGFGGTFCVKYPDISNAIVEQEDRGDRGHRRRHAARRRSRLPDEHGRQAAAPGRRRSHARHVAEVLAGMTDTPPIGEAG